MVNPLPILQINSEVLRQKARAVKEEEIKSQAIQDLIKKMKQVLKATPDGVGLAAPQVGQLLQIFIVSFEGFEKVFINPQLKSISNKKVIDEEGCLSVRGAYGLVPRAKSVKVKALDETGKPFKIRAKGFLARIIQHEIDHLNGVLFLDKAVNLHKE